MNLFFYHMKLARAMMDDYAKSVDKGLENLTLIEIAIEHLELALDCPEAVGYTAERAVKQLDLARRWRAGFGALHDGSLRSRWQWGFYPTEA